MTRIAEAPTIAVLGIRGFPGVQGGVETHCGQLYPRLRQCRFRVYRRKPYLVGESQAQYGNVDFIDLPTTRIQGLEAAWHTLLATLHCLWRRPALIHVHNMGPAAIALLAKSRGIPVVMTYHSVNYEHGKWGRCTRWLLRRCERMALRHCDRIIFVNRDRMTRFDAHVRQKSVYIPNGVTPATPTAETGWLTARGIRPGEYVLAVGRLTPEKGLEHLVRAAASGVVAQVVIAGRADNDDGYERRLRRLDTSGKVVFVGYAGASQLRQLYSHARLFVLPSLSEGFPLAMLEAMSYRLPVVVSDLSATRQVALPEHCYCRAGDTNALQAAIERRLQDGAARVNYDLSAFDWDEIARQTLDVYLAATGRTAMP